MWQVWVLLFNSSTAFSVGSAQCDWLELSRLPTVPWNPHSLPQHIRWRPVGHCWGSRTVGFQIWGPERPCRMWRWCCPSLGSAHCGQAKTCPLWSPICVFWAPACRWSAPRSMPLFLHWLLDQTIWQDWPVSVCLCVLSSVCEPKLPPGCRKTQSMATIGVLVAAEIQIPTHQSLVGFHCNNTPPSPALCCVQGVSRYPHPPTV